MTAAAPSRAVAKQKQVSHPEHDTANKSTDYVNGAPTCPACGRRLHLEAAIRAALVADPRRPAAAVAREVVGALGLPAARLRSVRREVARLAKLASGERLNLEVEEEVGEMPRGTPKTRNADDLGALLGRDVEARCAGGGCYRGTLQAVGDDFLKIERATTSRAVYVRRSGLVALVDETPPLLKSAGARDADAALDREEGE